MNQTIHCGASPAHRIQYPFKLRELGGAKVVTLYVYSAHKISSLKIMLLRKLGLQAGLCNKSLRLLHRGCDLNNDQNAADLLPYIEREDVFWTFDVRSVGNMSTDIELINSVVSPKCMSLFEKVRTSFLRGARLHKTFGGCGGSYTISQPQTTNILALVKPCDEESFAPANPNGYVGQLGSPSFRAGILSGEGGIRECVVSFLDEKTEGLASVPRCTMVNLIHPQLSYVDDEVVWKNASLHEYIDNHGTIGDFSASLFSVYDVQAIALLDIRTCNLDRTEGNILLKRHLGRVEADFKSVTINNSISRYQLIPIDHGYCLPDSFDVSVHDVIWYGMPQTLLPINESLKRRVLNVSVEEDEFEIGQLFYIRPECFRVYKIMNMLLTIAIQYEKTIHDIATIWLRKDIDEQSILEKAVELSLLETASVFRNAKDRMEIDPAGFSFQNKSVIKADGTVPDCWVLNNDSLGGKSTLNFDEFHVSKFFFKTLEKKLIESVSVA